MIKQNEAEKSKDQDDFSTSLDLDGDSEIHPPGKFYCQNE